MSVEKMEKVNIVGHMEDIDDVARQIILSSSVHMVNAFSEIQENNFPILNAKQDIDAVLEYNYIKQYTSCKNLPELKEKIVGMMDIFGLKKNVYDAHLRGRYSYDDDNKDISELYEKVKSNHEHFIQLDKEYKDLEHIQKYLMLLKDKQFNLTEALNMKYINVKFGRFSKANMDRFKKNYENVSAIIFRLYEGTNHVVVMMLVPESVDIEVSRVLSSLNFEEFKIKYSFEGTPAQWMEGLSDRRQQILDEKKNLQDELLEYKNKYASKIQVYYSRVMLEYKVEELKSYIACTNEFFYLTGWVPAHKKNKLMESIKKYDERLITIFKDAPEEHEGIQPPTCLRNSYLVRPFESIVKLYGIPSYNEMDPSAFLGITYMILFGAMFGDLGQGFILFAIGEFLMRKNHRPNLGGVFARLGISSMIFGLLYGSFFGFENVIPALLIRPMEKINNVLIAGVIFGVVLLTIGFVYNLINAFKNKDIENGIFSKNGVAGLVFYWLFLLLILQIVGYAPSFIPTGVVVVLMVIMLAVILLKEPLAHMIKGVKPLYNESASDYYIEGGFGVIETILSLFSNTVSFIRVGAFAINHVGLFIAFETLAEMVSGGAASAAILVIGNIIIIGLEGMIVFIQGLRLEYYELFSKYFIGDGYEYVPFHISSIKGGASVKNNDSFENEKAA